MLGTHEGSALHLALVFAVANGSLVQVRLLHPILPACFCAPHEAAC